MKCHDIVAVLDSHALSRLNAAQTAALDLHLATCESCCDHWQAQQALANQEVPQVRPELLVETRRLVAEQTPAPRSRSLSWRLVLGGGVLAGGAALAALGIVTQSERLIDGSASTSPETQISAPMTAESQAPSAESPAPSKEVPAPGGAPEAASGAVVSGTGAGQRGVLPDGDYFALLRVAPRYPVEAAERGLEGSVVVEFTVTRDGTVDEIMVVESTDTVFESAAVSAVEESKYMPRVVGGESVPVAGVRNKITFVLEKGAPVDSEAMRRHALMVVQDPSIRPSFWEIVAPGLEGCVDADDWSCAELVLDEANATYDFNPAEERALWKFYGYIFTKYEDYERAIAAYERALARPIYAEDTTRLTLAHLYFARQQYAQALSAALEYIETAPNPVPGAFKFVDSLRQLGITDTP